MLSSFRDLITLPDSFLMSLRLGESILLVSNLFLFLFLLSYSVSIRVLNLR
jgi:hypothetical protein